MATRFSIPPWRMPWTEEPGGPQSMGSQRVGYTHTHTHTCDNFQASLVAQTVMNLSAMQGAWVRFLGQEDPLEKEMATHSCILA